jgi:hypothetical protein
MPLPGSAEAAKTPTESIEESQLPEKLPSFSADDLDSWFGPAESPAVKKVREQSYLNTKLIYSFIPVVIGGVICEDRRSRRGG